MLPSWTHAWQTMPPVVPLAPRMSELSAQALHVGPHRAQTIPDILLIIVPAAEDGDMEQPGVQARWREHLRQALQALHTVLDAQPRCAALLASKPALAPLLQCIHPFCRCSGLI